MTGFDGLEQQAASIAGNQYDPVVRWMTTNVGLWPRPVAIVAGAGSWRRLTDTQRGWLVQAAKGALSDPTTGGPTCGCREHVSARQDRDGLCIGQPTSASYSGRSLLWTAGSANRRDDGWLPRPDPDHQDAARDASPGSPLTAPTGPARADPARRPGSAGPLPIPGACWAGQPDRRQLRRCSPGRGVGCGRSVPRRSGSRETGATSGGCSTGGASRAPSPSPPRPMANLHLELRDIRHPPWSGPRTDHVGRGWSAAAPIS